MQLLQFFYPQNFLILTVLESEAAADVEAVAAVAKLCFSTVNCGQIFMVTSGYCS